MGLTGPAARLLEDFAATFEDFPIGMWLLSVDGRVLRANTALCELLGRSEGELLGTDVAAHVHETDRPALAQALAELVSGRTASVRDTLRYLRADGDAVPVVVHRSSVPDDCGTAALVVVQAVDQTQQQQADRRLTASSSRAMALVALSDRLAVAGRDVEQACDVAVDALHGLLGGSVAVWLVDPADGCTLEAVAGRTDDPAASAEIRRLYAQAPPRADTGYFAEALTSGQPLVVERPWAEGPAMSEYADWLDAHPLAALLLAPLQHEGRPLGVLGSARYCGADGFDTEDVALAAQVARQLAAALADRQLLMLERSTVRRERAVAEVTRRCDETIDDPPRVVEAAVRAVSAQLGGAAALWVIDDDDAEHLGRSAVAHPDPAAEAVLRDYLETAPAVVTGNPALPPHVLDAGRVHVVGRDHTAALLGRVEGLREHADLLAPESLYAVRLLARGQVVGLLVVAGVGTRLSADDRRLVDTLADRLALALDNAALLASARSSQSRTRALVQHTSDMLLLVDRGGALRYASPAAGRVFGAQLGDDLLAVVVEEDRRPVRRAWARALATAGLSPALELRATDGDRRVRRLSVVVNNMLDDPAVDGVVLTVRDVTEERAASERLAERARQQAALATIGTTALTAELDELFRVAGRTIGETIAAYSSGTAQLLDDGSWLVLGGSDDAYVGSRLEVSATSGMATVARTGRPLVVHDYLDCDDISEAEAVEAYGVRSGVLAPIVVQGRVWGVVAAHSDQVGRFSAVDVDFLQTMATALAGAVERARFAERVLQQATTDDLTGLPNRVHLSHHLSELLAQPGASVALLLLDLDDFKDVNDSLGHGAGDQVLGQLGRRLAEAVGGSATVTRLGGDEFAVLLEGAVDEASVGRLADEIVRAVAEPFALPGIDVTLSASIGVAVAPQHGRNPEQLLQAADMAMYRAKGERTSWALYDVEQDAVRAERLSLLSELRLALSAGQLELHYQPLVDLRTDKVVEVEALVRWNHPQRGLLLPGAFLPIAEQTDLVHGLTRYVVRSAARQGREWRARGWPGTIAVNVSALALRPPDVVQQLRDELLRGEGTLTVELTESALIDERAREAVEILAKAGIRCSIDDFGTGYSSLSYLRGLPVSRLKLDRAFNRRVDRDRVDAAIVGGVVSLAHSVGLDVVAEGVETAEVAERLRELGVDVAQGWLYGRPQPASSLRLA